MSDRHADTAKAFHEAYERLAPSFGYETRKESAVPWEDVPENNRALMTAVCAEVVGALVDELAEARADNQTLKVLGDRWVDRAAAAEAALAEARRERDELLERFRYCGERRLAAEESNARLTAALERIVATAWYSDAGQSLFDEMVHVARAALDAGTDA